MDRKKFQAIAATTKTGLPEMTQLADNGGMKALKSQVHTYDSNRPKRQVVSRYSK